MELSAIAPWRGRARSPILAAGVLYDDQFDGPVLDPFWVRRTPRAGSEKKGYTFERGRLKLAVGGRKVKFAASPAGVPPSVELISKRLRFGGRPINLEVTYEPGSTMSRNREVGWELLDERDAAICGLRWGPPGEKDGGPWFFWGTDGKREVPASEGVTLHVIVSPCGRAVMMDDSKRVLASWRNPGGTKSVAIQLFARVNSGTPRVWAVSYVDRLAIRRLPEWPADVERERQSEEEK